MIAKRIAIIGLGTTGLSCINFFRKKDISVTVFDTRAVPPGKDQLDATTKLIIGPLSAQLLCQFDCLVVSPGIAIATPAIDAAIKAGVEVIGDIELFARELKTPPYQHAKLVTITGSNGKSTVTSLLGEMAIDAKVNVAVGGNIGVPALDLLAPTITLYILELSSFQLETTESLNADVSTILNVSEDHLDRYSSYQDYTAAKHKIYQQSQTVLINRDDPLTFTDKQPQLSFGFDQQHYGVILQHNEHYLSLEQQPLLTCSALKLSGKHNWMNALAALALGQVVDLPMPSMLSTLQTYSGLKHRCEFVKEVQGVRWINDSKATNVGATQAALLGLSDTIQGKVHVILGGDGKGADFSELKPVLQEVKGQIVCFGRDATLIAEQDLRTIIVENLDQAVSYINQQAEAGDLAILTPACASLDMYKNFMARGDHFISLVNALTGKI
ncbi:UDP-N-acetylmuramoyl-L-alanine--D-glutamate ligase [Psychromonas sp. SR45-3]|uniref:UDP-N-acetylmuramoyl-L-alanine--D-glutamate ligase n=1 Tax=Psychromonas sp. SR45-3 TaxID=2760930 RepID=UPI0015FCE6B9|nr:UDP-N-acetylmuramoyl-L-alanine--D-glutamate ligase [Psychromonas sp. SR45-3]MBB1272911.1 UDP-N-acetylmuramoyl-L-alanine--D-glutamate ligase [Psychromonas sp. SR45-3]